MNASAFQPGRSAPVGALDKRITIQQCVITQDDSGAPVSTWSDVATVWAHVHPLSGRELQIAQSTYAEVSHQIVIRYLATFANSLAVAAMRVVYSGRYFNIIASIDVEEAHYWIVLSVSEGLTNG